METPRRAARISGEIACLEAAVPRVTDTNGDHFRIELNGHTYDSRTEAAEALAHWALKSDLSTAPRYATRDYGAIGTISGFDLRPTTRPMIGDLAVELTLDGVPRSTLAIPREAFLDGGIGLIVRIENRVSGIPQALDRARSDLTAAEATITEAEQRIGRPFRHTQALADAEVDLTRVETQLAATQDDVLMPAAKTAPDARDHPVQPPQSVATFSGPAEAVPPAAEGPDLSL